jgi:hypothetical protein
MGRRIMHIVMWREGQKERDQYEEISIGGRIILIWVLEKEKGVTWTGFIWLRIKISRGFL